MAKKTGTKKMPATARRRRFANAVRLDLSDRHFERLECVADDRGLTKSSYARMAVIALIKQDEEAEGGKQPWPPSP